MAGGLPAGEPVLDGLVLGGQFADGFDGAGKRHQRFGLAFVRQVAAFQQPCQFCLKSLQNCIA